MPNTTFNRLEQIVPGTQPDTWGNTINRTWQRVDDALKGALNLPVSGDRYLTYSNGNNDEAHYSAFVITGGTGGKVFLQPVVGWWVVKNASANDVTFTINGIQGATVGPNEVSIVFSDGVSNVTQIGFDGDGYKAYVDAKDTATREYAAKLAFASVLGTLPNQPGNEGRFLKTDGTTPNWRDVEIEDVQNLETTLDEIRSEAIVYALIF